MKEIFQALRSILKSHEAKLSVQQDSGFDYYLNAKVLEKGKPVFFAMVKASKSKVAFHLMPVYCHPELLKGISVDLKKRMQGKSCFNFTKFDKDLFDELEGLTARSVEAFEQDGRI